MPLLLRLRHSVVIPAIWLERAEWTWRFRDDPEALFRIMDESPGAIVEDAGGVRGLIRSSHWKSASDTHRVCSQCKRDMPLPEFYQCSTKGNVRGVCIRCIHDNARARA